MWLTSKVLLTFGVLFLFLIGLTGCGGGGISLIVSDIQGPTALDELAYGEYSVEITSGTNITYQWYCNPSDAGEFYPQDGDETRFTAKETLVDIPVEIWVVINSDGEGPIIKKSRITVNAVVGVTVGAINGPYEVLEKSSHAYSIAASGAPEFAYEWSSNIPEFCAFETPDAAETILNFGDVPLNKLLEISVKISSGEEQPVARFIVVNVIAEVDFYVSGIEGPESLDEDEPGQYSVEIVSDKEPTFFWTCELQDAGTFDPPDAISTIFTPGWVYQDTTVDISVYVEAEGYEPVERDYGVMLEDHQYGWERHWGKAYCEDMVTDSMGNIYVMGSFDDADLDPGEGVWYSDAEGSYLSKFNSDGEFIWATTFIVNPDAQHYYANGNDLTIDEFDNIYMVGVFNGYADFMPGPEYDGRGSYLKSNGIWLTGMFISKQDPNGNVQWVNTWGGSAYDKWNSNTGYGIEVGSDGCIYVTGDFREEVDFDPGPGEYILDTTSLYIRAVFLCRFDSEGIFQWVRSFGGVEDLGQVIVSAVTTDAQDNAYISGHYYGDVDFDPGPGLVEIASNGLRDIFLCKFNPAGDFQWVRTWGGADMDTVSDISFNASSYLYATGAFTGSVDFDPGPGTDIRSQADGSIYVAKYNTDGVFSGAVNFGGTGYSDGEKVNFDNNGYIYVSGNTEPGDFDPGPGFYELWDGAFLLKLDSNFEFQWARLTVQGEYANGKGVAFAQSGDIYVCAHSKGETDLIPTPVDEWIDFNGYHSLLLMFAEDGYW